MEHYEKLIIKGLINGGGSSSETYTYKILTGNVSKNDRSVEGMWQYLDKPLQKMLIDILKDMFSVDIEGKSEAELISKLKEYMAKKSGNALFYTSYARSEIDSMSDEKFERLVAACIECQRTLINDL